MSISADHSDADVDGCGLPVNRRGGLSKPVPLPAGWLSKPVPEAAWVCALAYLKENVSAPFPLFTVCEYEVMTTLSNSILSPLAGFTQACINPADALLTDFVTKKRA